MEDWGKYTTVSIRLQNGQSKQIHFYYNKITDKVNYNIDFKVANPVKPFDAMRVISDVDVKKP